MNILIIKYGALGDVVRTSFFLRPLKQTYNANIYWITSAASYELLCKNPHLTEVVTDIATISHIHFDKVFSLDDETESLSNLSKIKYDQVIGAFDDEGKVLYTKDCADWFDMGLISKYGKQFADQLKKKNTRTHSEIFKSIFGVASVIPEVFYDKVNPSAFRNMDLERTFLIGINPFAGQRWASKELIESELISLIKSLLTIKKIDGKQPNLVLFGYGADRVRLERLKKLNFDGLESIIIPDTDESYELLINCISELSYMFTSDSFALHLCNATGIPFIAFFAPTSAEEIDLFVPNSLKIKSQQPDYCSYERDADNSDITAELLFMHFLKLHNVELS